MQLLLTIHDSVRGLWDKEQIDVMMLDFLKAFDKVPPLWLLQELHFYGVHGPHLSYTSNFLQNYTHASCPRRLEVWYGKNDIRSATEDHPRYLPILGIDQWPIRLCIVWSATFFEDGYRKPEVSNKFVIAHTFKKSKSIRKSCAERVWVYFPSFLKNLLQREHLFNKEEGISAYYFITIFPLYQCWNMEVSSGFRANVNVFMKFWFCLSFEIFPNVPKFSQFFKFSKFSKTFQNFPIFYKIFHNFKTCLTCFKFYICVNSIVTT